jgi:hypothetical protein
MRRLRRSVGTGLAGVFLAAGIAGTAGAQNLIVNGSFEEPNVPTPGIGFFPSIPGWSHQARPGTTSAGFEIQDHVAGAPAAGAGSQFVELDSDGPSRIFQSVATSAGSTYRLSFLYSARPGTPAVDNDFQVTAGPATLHIGPLTSAGQTQWQAGTVSFVATGASSLIEFLDLGPEQPAGAGIGAYIDLVSVELTNSPPVCTAVAPNRASLWPPNHKLRTITVSGATDPDSDPVAITITGVTQDEPVNGKGDGNTSPDHVLGPAAGQARLRAERAGGGDGRVYTIAFTTTDPSGAGCSGSVAVGVPHDRRGTAVDSNPQAVSPQAKDKPGNGKAKGHGRRP